MIEFEPTPKTIADKLRDMRPGENRLFIPSDGAPSSVRATITRIKIGAETNYTTRPWTGGLMVWRLG